MTTPRRRGVPAPQRRPRVVDTNTPLLPCHARQRRTGSTRELPNDLDADRFHQILSRSPRTYLSESPHPSSPGVPKTQVCAGEPWLWDRDGLTLKPLVVTTAIVTEEGPGQQTGRRGCLRGAGNRWMVTWRPGKTLDRTRPLPQEPRRDTQKRRGLLTLPSRRLGCRPTRFRRRNS